jgi:ribonucleoside-diphosphate reductase alpha chain|nr:MAG TPA: ribonucleoside-diphosphate reductase, adenosylcobalamin-dependent [Bacteriophage sp.]
MTVEQWLNNDELAITIWKNKYRFKDESLDDWFKRVSGGNEIVEEQIKAKKFIFGGRILANRGLSDKNRKITYSNCYVVAPPKDNLESIFDCGAKLARTFSYGGGCGIDISNLRPSGARVNNAAKTTSGAVSFMDFYSYITGLIGQSGRRGALMISISCDHPDLEEFIEIKSDLDKVTKANISVRVSDKFMEAVVKGETLILKFVTDTGEVITKEVEAYPIFRKLAQMNWDYAEPGILFWDRITSWNLLSNNKEFSYAGVNPCAEEPLPAGGSCLLGSINLAEFVTKEGTLDLLSLRETIQAAVIALNEVLDEGLPLHPLQEQRDSVADWRQIGLGVMGLADMLIKLKVKYGSATSRSVIESIGHELIMTALETSSILAASHGPYPKFNRDYVIRTPFFKNLDSGDMNDLRFQSLYDDVYRYGLRNSQLLTCAPTGSIATMLGVSTGCEPIFATSYTRKTESLVNEERYYKVYTPIIKELIDKGFSEEALPEYVVTSEQIPYRERIKVQATLQKFIDASISSTINLPESATIDDVETIYRLAWEEGLKGVTVYRSGCKRGAVLSKNPVIKECLKRPESVEAKLIRFKNGSENWIAFVGLIDGRPYEIFTGINNIEDFPIPTSITEGEIIKVKDSLGKRYDFQYTDKYGYTNRLGGLSRIFNQEYWNYAKLISALLRGGIELDKVVKIIDGMHFESDTLNTWKNGVKRAIKTFIVDGVTSHEVCPDCGEHLIYEGGCTICKNCGFSKCG